MFDMKERIEDLKNWEIEGPAVVFAVIVLGAFVLGAVLF